MTKMAGTTQQGMRKVGLDMQRLKLGNAGFVGL
jgi:hypothetical protein